MPVTKARTRRMSRLLAGPLAATAVLGTIVGCTSSSPTTSVTGLVNRDVVVAAVPATGATGLYIAQQDGFFKQAGLNVKIESSASAAVTMSGLLHGNVDITLGQWTSAISAEAGGVRLRAVAAGNNGGPGLETLATVAGSRIKTIAQLRGATIAVNALNGLSQLIVESILSTSGVQANQVHFTVFPFPLMTEALLSHKADAAFMVEPYMSVGEQTKGIAVLTDIDQGPTRDFPITGYFTTAAWAHKYPATLAAFTAALERGESVASTDRAAVEKAMMAFIHVTPLTASMMALGTFPIGINPVQLRRVADLMRVHGQLPLPSADAETPIVNALATGGSS